MDQNSSFFQAVIREKKAQHNITRLQRGDGSFAITDEEIAQEVIAFYEKLFGIASTQLQPVKNKVLQRGPILNEQDKLILCQPVTEEEIRIALYSISDQKAPGPDGYGFKFFTAAWDIVQEDVINVVTNFFNTGELLVC